MLCSLSTSCSTNDNVFLEYKNSTNSTDGTSVAEYLQLMVQPPQHLESQFSFFSVNKPRWVERCASVMDILQQPLLFMVVGSIIGTATSIAANLISSIPMVQEGIAVLSARIDVFLDPSCNYEHQYFESHGAQAKILG